MHIDNEILINAIDSINFTNAIGLSQLKYIRNMVHERRKMTHPLPFFNAEVAYHLIMKSSPLNEYW